MKKKLLLLMMAVLGITMGALAGDFKIGNYTLKVGDQFTGESGLTGLAAGRISFDDATHVTMENVTISFSTHVNYAISSSISNLTITLIGENKIQGTGTETGLYASQVLTISGTGSLAIDATKYGILIGYTGNFTINNATVSAKGGDYGFGGNYHDYTKLNLQGDGMLRAYGGTQCIEDMGVVSGVVATSPSKANYSASDYTVLNAMNNPIYGQWVALQKAIPINATNFPDENFRTYVSKYKDSNKDVWLSDGEIAKVTSMDASEKEISDLTGIGFFTALKSLDCSENQLTTLDVSKNTKLEKLECYNNKLTTLDVSKNTLLKTLYCYANQLKTLSVSKNTALEELSCGNNQLTVLDVSKNTALKRLSCYTNQLTTLDVSKNTALEVLYCFSNDIRGEGMQTLVNSLCDRSQTWTGYLYVYNSEEAEGNEMTTTQVAAAKAKKWEAWFYKGGPYSGVDPTIAIDATNFPDENFRNWILAQTYGADGLLSESEFAGVTSISISHMNISNLKGIEFFTALQVLYCSNNQLTTLDISKNTALEVLACSSNKLTTLDVSKNTALYILACSSNKLTTLDVSKNTALGTLECAGNQLTTLNVSKNTKLQKLYCYGNGIRGEGMATLVSSLYDRSATESGELHVYQDETATGNEMTAEQVAAATAKNWQAMMSNDGGSSWVDYPGVGADIAIDATNFPDANFRNWILAQTYGADGFLSAAEIAEVTEMRVDSKGISNLKGIEFFTALKDLYCSSNQLTELDISKNSTLVGLLCYKNQLTTLDVSKNTALEVLICFNNQLTTLDVSKNTVLKGLLCSGNQLTTLDVSKNTALKSLSCSYNQLTTLVISKNTPLETLECGDNQLTTLNISNAALTELYCYNNQLTALNVSKNTKLQKLHCYKNKIRGEAMQTLVNGLCDRSATSSGEWHVYRNESATGNEMTTEQVAAAKGKNWQVLMYKNGDWVDYPGVATGTVTLNKTEVVVRKKKTVTLTATLSPETLADKSVTWKSSDESVATVSSDGVVTGVKSGVVTITCTSVATGAKATCTVTVGTITLNKSEVAVNKGKTVTLKPTVYPTTLADQSVTWKSSKTTVATVSSTGEVTGVKAGTATITCTSNATGLSTTCKVTVGYVKLDKSKVIVKKNNTVTLTPTVYPSSLDDKSVKWKSSDKTIATVSSTGKVKGVKSGFVTITCTSVATGLSTTCQVTVGTITLDKKEAIVRKKKTLTLTPTVYPSALTDKSVKWKSSDKSVATVSSDGVVTGVKSGVVTITCTSNATGLSATCQVTVGTITLDKSTAAVGKGKTITLTPTVYPTSLEDKSVTWKSSKTSVATVTSTGKVKGVKAGKATITCTSNATGLSTTCKVTVGIAIDATNFPDEKFRSYVSSNCDPDKDGILTNDEIAAVKQITISNKGITDLKGVELFTALYYLSCYDNKLTTLDVSKLTGLEYLYCYNNKLTTLDVSKNTLLKNLKCYKNQLTTLDISKNKKLTQLYCYGNKIRGDGMKALISNLYDRSSTSAGKLYVYNQETSTGNKMTKSQVSSVKAKNWQVLMNNGTDWLDYPGGTPASASARAIDGDDEELTDIEIVEETPAAEEPFDVFDLSGHKVRQRVMSLDGLPAGVYIVKGKKVLKK